MGKTIKYYQLKKPVYDRHGFDGYEDYRQPFNTIEEARYVKNNFSVYGDLEIFEITVKERIVK